MADELYKISAKNGKMSRFILTVAGKLCLTVKADLIDRCLMRLKGGCFGISSKPKCRAL
jgi:hypothetical protein